MLIYYQVMLRPLPSGTLPLLAAISGPFGDDGDIRGITIYNVPTLKMADSLANIDPAVVAGRLEIEVHPWWAAKGFPLR